MQINEKEIKQTISFQLHEKELRIHKLTKGIEDLYKENLKTMLDKTTHKKFHAHELQKLTLFKW